MINILLQLIGWFRVFPLLKVAEWFSTPIPGREQAASCGEHISFGIRKHKFNSQLHFLAAG